MSTPQPAIHPDRSAYERRTSRRVRLVTQVESKSSCAVSTLGHSENISQDGLSVETGETIEPRTEVIVRFHLPAPPRVTFIEAVGEVVSVRPAGSMGIRFVDLNFWERKAIEEFVERAEEDDA